MERCKSQLTDRFGSTWHCTYDHEHTGPHAAMWTFVSKGYSYPLLNWDDTRIHGPAKLGPFHRLNVLV